MAASCVKVFETDPLQKCGGGLGVEKLLLAVVIVFFPGGKSAEDLVRLGTGRAQSVNRVGACLISARMISLFSGDDQSRKGADLVRRRCRSFAGIRPSSTSRYTPPTPNKTSMHPGQPSRPTLTGCVGFAVRSRPPIWIECPEGGGAVWASRSWIPSRVACSDLGPVRLWRPSSTSSTSALAGPDGASRTANRDRDRDRPMRLGLRLARGRLRGMRESTRGGGDDWEIKPELCE